MEGYIGGIALPTNVTLGKCIPSMLCVVDVYLTDPKNVFNLSLKIKSNETFTSSFDVNVK